jgi:uncharacterized protein
VDHWAFNADDVDEFMSMEHARVAMDKLVPKPGDSMATNQRRPIVTFVEDTSPGVHDTLIAACDAYRYRQLGVMGYHENCTDNLANALKAVGVPKAETPCPFNLFQNSKYIDGKGFDFRPAASKKGDYVLFRADMNIFVCFSACPHDISPINSGKPTEAHVEVI